MVACRSQPTSAKMAPDTSSSQSRSRRAGRAPNYLLGSAPRLRAGRPPPRMGGGRDVSSVRRCSAPPAGVRAPARCRRAEVRAARRGRQWPRSGGAQVPAWGGLGRGACSGRAAGGAGATAGAWDGAGGQGRKRRRRKRRGGGRAGGRPLPARAVPCRAVSGRAVARARRAGPAVLRRRFVAAAFFLLPLYFWRCLS